MTPQENSLVDELFDRLTTLENMPRDPDAERLIANGMQRAPHAVYALVQTALVQDEALKRANARIEELQGQLRDGEQRQPQAGFLDTMRESMLGRQEPRGSVPTVRSPAMSSPATATPPSQQDYSSPPPPMPAGPPFGARGSFLGTAASAAAGVMGGSLLLDGIRSMFGHSFGGAGHDAFGSLGDHTASTSGSAADSDLARDAGIDHIGNAAEHEQDHAADGGTDSTDVSDDRNDADNDDVADDDDDVTDDDDFGNDDLGDGGGDFA